MTEAQKYYKKKLENLSAGVVLKINSTFYNLILELSQNIALYPNKNTIQNKLLKSTLNDMRKQLVDEVKGLVRNWSEKSTTLATTQNTALLTSYLKGIKGAEAYIKTNLDRGIYKINLRDVSTRVWKYTEPYFAQIELLLNAGAYNGMSAVNIAKDLRKLLNDPHRISINELRRLGIEKAGGEKAYRAIEQQILNYKPGRGVYKSAKKNALRLAQNETNLSFRRQDFLQMNNFGFVKGWLVELSGQHPRIDMCDDLEGKYPQKFQFSGWHVKCICFATPILATDKQAAKIIQEQKINIKQVDKIPKRAENWIKDNAEKINKAKSKPYWIADNDSYVKTLL